MKVADATVAFLGEYSGLEKDVAAGAQPAANKLGSIFQTAMKSAFSQKLEIGGALFTGLGVGLTAMNDPIEKAQATLRQVIENTGNSWDAYKGKVEDAINTQARFGHGSADTQEALGKLTAAYQDPKKALEEMSLATQIAAVDHISLTAAADKVVKMHGGAARTFKEFGINVADMKKEIAAATAAEKADTTAGDALAKAKQHLADVHAQLAGKTHLTSSEQITLRNATDAVATAATKANDAHEKSVAAQAKAKGATADYDKIMHDQLLPRLHGVAEAQADTWGGRLLGYKTNVLNFVGQAAGPLGHGLTVLGPLMTGVGGAMQFAGPVAGAIKNFAVWTASGLASAAKTAASFVATGAVWVARNAAMLLSWAATTLIYVASSVAAGLAAAAAFLLPLLPFILIGAAVALLVFLVVTHFTQIKDFVTGVVGHIIDFVSGMVGKIVGFFGEMAPKVGKAILDILLFLPGLELKALEFFGSLVGKIVGFFGSIAGQLVAIGGKIIDGLISGLLGGIGKIAGAVGQVAGSVVSGFKGLLGIHSPSTVFADQVGGPIVEGIGVGITKSGAAHRALAGLHLTAPNIGGIASGNMSLSALSGAAAGGKAGGIHVGAINITNPIAEPASTSTARELRKLGYLGQAS